MTTVRVLGKDVKVKVVDGKLKLAEKTTIHVLGRPVNETYHRNSSNKESAARYRARKRGETVLTPQRHPRPSTGLGMFGIAAKVLFDSALDLLVDPTEDVNGWWFDDSFEAAVTLPLVAEVLGQEPETLRAYGYDIVRGREDALAAA